MPPAFLLILGALLVPLLPAKVRSLYVIALPAIALVLVWGLPEGDSWNMSVLMGFGDITLLQVDRLSRVFGIIFTMAATIAFTYAFYVKGSTQHVAALMYIGSALGVTFAGDLISLYVFWEMMAVTSAFVILARNTEKAKAAAFRYVIVHIVGGLMLLAGIVLTVGQYGTIGLNELLANGAFSYANANLGTWLMLLGVLVNAAAPPFSAWLSDAYPEASPTGSVILSAYTTKTTVYVLLTLFAGWEPLLAIGCMMTIYGVVFALMENDMRRILAYSVISQVGFMVCAAGIASTDPADKAIHDLAINGAAAHAFCHIIYKSLLWMAAGAVLYRVGKSRCTELGGLYKSMPWTLIFCVIGALSIAMPLTCGFVSKTMIVYAAEKDYLFWVWLVLEIASACVFMQAGVKFTYLVFFNEDKGLRPKEAPNTMLLAMGILAFLCIFLGVYPDSLYSLLPFEVNYDPMKLSYIITHMQLLMFSVLVFFLFRKHLKRTATITLDTDWFYRKGAPVVAAGLDKTLNSLNEAAHKTVVKGLIGKLAHFFRTAPSRTLTAIATVYWKAKGIRGEELAEKRRAIFQEAKLGAFPVGITAGLAVMFLALLYIFGKLN